MTEGNSWKPEDNLKRSGGDTFPQGVPKRMHNGGRQSRKTPGWGWLRILGFPFGVLLLAVLFSSPLHALEDSARLVFQKTASSGKSRVHVVKKGEFIDGILRSHFGNKPVPYALIRRLNPGIRNPNRIRPGQRIVLPVPGSSKPSE